MSTVYGKAGWIVPSLTDAPNAPAMIQAVATQIDPFVIPKYASAAAQAAANPTPADGDNWYRTDLSQGFQFRNLGGGITLADADSHGYITEQTMTGTTLSVTLSAIPQTYQNLRLIVQGKGIAASADDVTLRFNADSGSNYVTRSIVENNVANSTGAVWGVSGAAVTSIKVGALANAGGGHIAIDIPFYTGATSMKSLSSLAHTGPFSTGTHQTGILFGLWNSAAAITSITLSVGSGFATGAFIGLYGFGS